VLWYGDTAHLEIPWIRIYRDFVTRMISQVNNNLRCYDLSIELSHTIMEALTLYYVEQVNVMCTSLGFCELAFSTGVKSLVGIRIV
jgi:hypothetical protein